jgi:hypothetical protein
MVRGFIRETGSGDADFLGALLSLWKLASHTSDDSRHGKTGSRTLGITIARILKVAREI